METRPATVEREVPGEWWNPACHFLRDGLAEGVRAGEACTVTFRCGGKVEGTATNILRASAAVLLEPSRDIHRCFRMHVPKKAKWEWYQSQGSMAGGELRGAKALLR